MHQWKMHYKMPTWFFSQIQWSINISKQLFNLDNKKYLLVINIVEVHNFNNIRHSLNIPFQFKKKSVPIVN